MLPMNVFVSLLYINELGVYNSQDGYLVLYCNDINNNYKIPYSCLRILLITAFGKYHRWLFTQYFPVKTGYLFLKSQILFYDNKNKCLSMKFLANKLWITISYVVLQNGMTCTKTIFSELSLENLKFKINGIFNDVLLTTIIFVWGRFIGKMFWVIVKYTLSFYQWCITYLFVKIVKIQNCGK